MAAIVWDDQLGNRSRAPWLLLIKEGVVTPFLGQPVFGLVDAVGTSYTKNGKWSYTTYRLMVTDDVRSIPGKQGWETGTFREGLASALGVAHIDTWAEMSAALGVSVEECKRFLRLWKKTAAEAFDAADAMQAREKSC